MRADLYNAFCGYLIHPAEGPTAFWRCIYYIIMLSWYAYYILLYVHQTRGRVVVVMCALRFRRRYLSPCRIYMHTKYRRYKHIICINRTEYTIYIYIPSGHTGRVIRSLIRYARFACLGHPPATSRHFHPPKPSPLESERLSLPPNGTRGSLILSSSRARANSCACLFAVDDGVFAKSQT